MYILEVAQVNTAWTSLIKMSINLFTYSTPRNSWKAKNCFWCPKLFRRLPSWNYFSDQEKLLKLLEAERWEFTPISRTIYLNSAQKVRNFFETECFFTLLLDLEVSQIKYIKTIQFQRNNWDLDIYFNYSLIADSKVSQ